MIENASLYHHFPAVAIAFCWADAFGVYPHTAIEITLLWHTVIIGTITKGWGWMSGSFWVDEVLIFIKPTA